MSAQHLLMLRHIADQMEFSDVDAMNRDCRVSEVLVGESEHMRYFTQRYVTWTGSLSQENATSIALLGYFRVDTDNCNCCYQRAECWCCGMTVKFRSDRYDHETFGQLHVYDHEESDWMDDVLARTCHWGAIVQPQVVDLPSEILVNQDQLILTVSENVAPKVDVQYADAIKNMPHSTKSMSRVVSRMIQKLISLPNVQRTVDMETDMFRDRAEKVSADLALAGYTKRCEALSDDVVCTFCGVRFPMRLLGKVNPIIVHCMRSKCVYIRVLATTVTYNRVQNFVSRFNMVGGLVDKKIRRKRRHSQSSCGDACPTENVSVDTRIEAFGEVDLDDRMASKDRLHICVEKAFEVLGDPCSIVPNWSCHVCDDFRTVYVSTCCFRFGMCEECSRLHKPCKFCNAPVGKSCRLFTMSRRAHLDEKFEFYYNCY